MRVITLLLLVAALSGCNSAEKEMLVGVRDQLKDPKSAEFTRLKLHELEDGSGYVLCGMVNAKNSFGGYDGAKPFTVLKSTDEKEEMDVDIGDKTKCESMLKIADEAIRNRKKY